MADPMVPTGASVLEKMAIGGGRAPDQFKRHVPAKLLPFSFTYLTWKLYEDIAAKPLSECKLWVNKKAGVVNRDELLSMLQAGLYDVDQARPLYTRNELAAMLTPDKGLLVARMVDLVIEESNPKLDANRLRAIQARAERGDPKYYGL